MSFYEELWLAVFIRGLCYIVIGVLILWLFD
jgi:hypothetical protein